MMAQITLTALQQATIDKYAKFILQPDMLKRSTPIPASAESGSCAVELAGSGGCSCARTCRSATAGVRRPLRVRGPSVFLIKTKRDASQRMADSRSARRVVRS